MGKFAAAHPFKKWPLPEGFWPFMVKTYIFFWWNDKNSWLVLYHGYWNYTQQQSGAELQQSSTSVVFLFSSIAAAVTNCATIYYVMLKRTYVVYRDLLYTATCSVGRYRDISPVQLFLAVWHWLIVLCCIKGCIHTLSTIHSRYRSYSSQQCLVKIVLNLTFARFALKSVISKCVRWCLLDKSIGEWK